MERLCSGTFAFLLSAVQRNSIAQKDWQNFSDLVPLIVACILLRPCFFFWRKYRLLRLHGITVQGSVTERHLEHLSNGQPWYYLTCRYMYEGRPYVSDQPVWRGLYDSADFELKGRKLTAFQVNGKMNAPSWLQFIGDNGVRTLEGENLYRTSVE